MGQGGGRGVSGAELFQAVLLGERCVRAQLQSGAHFLRHLEGRLLRDGARGAARDPRRYLHGALLCAVFFVLWFVCGVVCFFVFLVAFKVPKEMGTRL